MKRSRAGTLWLAIAALLSLTVTVQYLRDPDVWWHLAVGRLIASGGIPTAEPFSFMQAAHPWVGQGWLYELTLDRLVTVGPGLASVVMGLVATAGLVLAARSTPRGIRVPGPLLVAGIMLSALVAGQVLGVRSQVITVLGVASTLLVIARWREGSRRAVWALPPLLLVWANLHAGFVAGLVLPVIALLVHRPRAGAPAVDRRGLALATCASALATLVNPGGPAIYPYLLETFGNPTLTQGIVEWMSPNFHDLYPRLLEVEALALVTVWVASDGPEPLDLVLAGAAFAATLQAQRNVAIFAVIALPQLLRYGSETWCRHRPALERRFPSGLDRLPRGLSNRPALLPVTAAAVAIGVGMAVAPVLSATAARSREAASFPRAAVDDIAARHPGQRVYTTYELGGYLAHRLPEGRVVFIYGESAIFGNTGLQRYLDIHLLRPGWPEAIRRDGFRVAMLPSESQETSAFAVLSWRIECRDQASDTLVMVPPAAGAAGPDREC